MLQGLPGAREGRTGVGRGEKGGLRWGSDVHDCASVPRPGRDRICVTCAAGGRRSQVGVKTHVAETANGTGEAGGARLRPHCGYGSDMSGDSRDDCVPAPAAHGGPRPDNRAGEARRRRQRRDGPKVVRDSSGPPKVVIAPAPDEPGRIGGARFTVAGSDQGDRAQIGGWSSLAGKITLLDAFGLAVYMGMDE